jgi:hypothetical protein
MRTGGLLPDRRRQREFADVGSALGGRGGVMSSAYVYGNSITYRDITAGNNGAQCLIGYDLCTGRGSWTVGTP